MQMKKGISLIVLVITIIVMIILAATIILAINNNNVVDKAKDAVNETNLKQIQELASVGWAEGYVGGKRTQTELDTYVKEYLTNSGIDATEQAKYTIEVTTEGVTVSKKTDGTVVAEGWTQTGTVVTDGTTILEVGDYVDYEAGVEGYDDTNGWRVLGAENGEILLVSATYVDELTLGGSTLAEAQTSFTTAKADLDGACEAYGEGDKATGVRSITGEDVDRVAQYDKTAFTGADYYDLMVKMNGWTSEQATQSLGEKTLYNIMDYGREVTFSWDSTEKPVYSYLDGNETVTGSLTDRHNSFTWYDEENKVWRTSTNKYTTGAVADDNDATKVAKVKNDAAIYLGSDKIASDKAAYEMLIANADGNLRYWLASPFVIVHTLEATFGFRIVGEGAVNCGGFVRQDGWARFTAGVRAVVSLETDVQLKEVTDTSWTIAN